MRSVVTNANFNYFAFCDSDSLERGGARGEGSVEKKIFFFSFVKIKTLNSLNLKARFVESFDLVLNGNFVVLVGLLRDKIQLPTDFQVRKKKIFFITTWASHFENATRRR